MIHLKFTAALTENNPSPDNNTVARRLNAKNNDRFKTTVFPKHKNCKAHPGKQKNSTAKVQVMQARKSYKVFIMFA